MRRQVVFLADQWPEPIFQPKRPNPVFSSGFLIMGGTDICTTHFWVMSE
jgi:hypothetical protein